MNDQSRGTLVLLGGAYLVLYVGISLTHQSWLVDMAPTSIQDIAQTTAYLSVAVNTGVLTTVYGLIFFFTWMYLVLAGAETSISALQRAVVWFLAAAILLEMARLAVGYKFLLPVADNRFSSPEQYRAFLEEDLPSSKWKQYQRVLNMSFLVFGGVASGLGYAQDESADYLDACICGTGVALGLAVLQAVNVFFA